AGFDDFATITLVCSPDEKIGSPFSRPLLEALAADHDVAVGLEAARVGGELVSARKGISAFTIEVTGKAVHAGGGPTGGVKAGRGGPPKTAALQALNGRWPGVTCNVGVVRAGTRTNVVADRAVMEVEGRGATRAAFDQAMGEVGAGRAARPAFDEGMNGVERIVAATPVPGAHARLAPAHRHPPMERTPA